MSYQAIKYNDVIDNPAGKYSRIFKYTGTSNENIWSSKCKYFEADTETCPIDEKKSDQITVAFSLAPKMANQTYAICSTTYTDQDTTYRELLNSLWLFGCDGGGTGTEIYCYIHNLDYDGIFMLNWLLKDLNFEQTQQKLSAKSAKYNENKFSILHNNGLLEIRVIWKCKCIIFRNSYRIWDDSIENIADELIKINEKDIAHHNPPSFPLICQKLSDDFDYDKIRSYGEKASEKEIAYMLNDVNVGVSILKMFEKFTTLGVSSSGMAYSICVDSFQHGILTSNIIKYLLKNYLSELVEADELGRFLRCTTDGDTTYVWCKCYDTVVYDELTKKSDEYITSFPSVRYRHGSKSIVMTKISSLMGNQEINFLRILSDALSKIQVSEFAIYNELRKNIVFWEFEKDVTDLTLYEKIYMYIGLPNERDIKSNPKIFNSKKKNKRLIKSIDQYYELAFPPLTRDEDEHLRPAYHGGISNAVELYSNTEQHNIVSIDINSSYSNQMANCRLPYGKPIFFKYEPESDVFYNEEIGVMSYNEIFEKYPLCIVKFQVSYRLQHPYVPIVPYKSDYNVAKYRYSDTKARQIDEDEYLYMTNHEFKIFCETHNCNVEDAYIDEIWCFNSAIGIFDKFVNRLFKIKQKHRGTALYQPVKVMLNSVYGRFAMNRFKFVTSDTYVQFDARNILYFSKQSNNRDIDTAAIGSYLPVAIFTTAEARCQLIETANTINLCGGHSCYFDTDSIHFSAEKIAIDADELVVNDVYTGITVNNALGAWKIEICDSISDDGIITGYENGNYICAKRYIETHGENKNIRCAGVPKKSQLKMNAADLRLGSEVKSRTKYRTKNGVVIAEINKRLALNTNVYATTLGTVCADYRAEVGDIVTDMYGRKTEITDIIYTVPLKRRFELM